MLPSPFLGKFEVCEGSLPFLFSFLLHGNDGCVRKTNGEFELEALGSRVSVPKFVVFV